jgi:hypothetical protein
MAMRNPEITKNLEFVGVCKLHGFSTYISTPKYPKGSQLDFK